MTTARDLNTLSAADTTQVALFRPYCGTSRGAAQLPRALTLFARKELVGARQVKGGSPVPFSLRWQPGASPADMCLCVLAIEALEGTRYTFSVPNHAVVSWLQETLDAVTAHPPSPDAPDLPQRFWTMLFAT